jgi:RAT1-interacting protein
MPSSLQILTVNISVWDCKPQKKDAPINWVELKTSAEIYTDNDLRKYERKLLKFWAQSFLLGVPKIVVGFRNKQGILGRLEDLETRDIPGNVKRRGNGTWDGNICINFTAGFLECMTPRHVFTHSLIFFRD